MSLIKKISKNFRYEIRRAQKEGIEVEIYNGNEAFTKPELLKELQNSYNSMFAEKNITKRLNMKYINAALKNDAMIISVAVDRKTNQNLVYHAYVVDKKNSLLLYSTSKLWTDKNSGNLIGYANKYLHWVDICYMKENGRINYEWGGISSKDNPNGIDKFKMSFGGEVIQLKNCIFANSIKGNLYVKLLKEREKKKNENYN